MRVAAVDIGTNTVRLLVAECLPDDLFEGERLEWLDRRVAITRLGQGVDRDQRLSEEAMGRTVAVLAGYGEAIRAWDVDAVRAVATSATRDAANRAAFLRRAALALGTSPEVISGAQEAELAFRGALSGIAAEVPALVIDVGGGSTEFVMGSTELEFATSVDIGSVRLTERFLAVQPPDPADLVAARDHAAAILEGVALPGQPASVIGVAGTFTSLAAIAADLPSYDPTVVHGSMLSIQDLDGIVERLAPLDAGQIAAIPSLDPARAPVVLGGAIVAREAMRAAGAETIVVSESDVLDGIALSAGA